LKPDHQVEKMIVVAVKQKSVSLRLDHSHQGLLRFGSGGSGGGKGGGSSSGGGGSAMLMMESEAMRGQLTTLAHQLEKVVAIVNPAAAAAASAAAAGRTAASADSKRAVLFAAVRSNMDKEHAAALNRKVHVVTGVNAGGPCLGEGTTTKKDHFAVLNVPHIYALPPSLPPDHAS
jgi:hypothetical protein